MSTVLGQHPPTLSLNGITEPVINYDDEKPPHSESHSIQRHKNGNPPQVVQESKSESQNNEVQSPVRVTVCEVTGDGEEGEGVTVCNEEEGRGEVEEAPVRRLPNGKSSASMTTTLHVLR